MAAGEVAPGERWLALGPASRLLGVDGDTLRRWADQGRLEAFITPGGHRRFRHSALEAIAASRRVGRRPPLARLGATPDRLSAAYRRSYGVRVATGPDARAAVEPPDREAFRHDGRRLVEALLRYLDAGSDDGTEGAAARGDAFHRHAAEAEAGAIVSDLASRLADLGVSLSESIGLFVAARRPFLAELSALANRRSLDGPQVGALYEGASGLLDRLLIRFIDAHQARPGNLRTTTAGSEG